MTFGTLTTGVLAAWLAAAVILDWIAHASPTGPGERFAARWFSRALFFFLIYNLACAHDMGRSEMQINFTASLGRPWPRPALLSLALVMLAAAAGHYVRGTHRAATFAYGSAGAAALAVFAIAKP